MAFGRTSEPAVPVAPADAAGAPARRTAALATAYLALVAAFAVATSVWGGFRIRVTVPHRDDWLILDDMFARSSLGQWLWADQNGHRMPGTLLLFHLDYLWARGTMLLPALASIACTWGAAATLVACFGREARATAARPALGFALFVLFWSANSFDVTWGLQASNVMAATGALVALASFAAWAVRSGAGPARRAAPLLVVTLVAATFATFSHGLGFGVWPALLAVALLVRARPQIVALVGAAALVELAVYVVGVRHGHGAAHYGDLLLHHVVGVWRMDAAFLGASPTRVLAALGGWSDELTTAVSPWIGALAMGVAGLRIHRLASAPARLRTRDVFGVGLMAVCAASGGLMALNRFPFEGAAVDVRFATWTGLFWVGLVCTLPGAGDPPRDSRAGAAAALVVGLSALMLPGLRHEWSRQRLDADRAEAAVLLHVLGIRWDAMSGAKEFGGSPARTYRVVDHMQADQGGMFAGERDELLGSRLHDRFDVRARRHCRGDVLWRRPIEARTGPALRIAGSTSEAGAARTLAAVFTDDGDVIRGLAVHVARLEPFLRQSFLPVDHGWLGAIAAYDPGARYTVNLVRPDGRSVCRGSAFRNLD